MSFDITLQHRIGHRDIALELKSARRVVALVGPSGIGKSSVLHCLAGLARPQSGTIAIAGRVLFDSRQGIDLAVHQRRAGVVFQDMRLFAHMRVAANLAYGARFAQRRVAPVEQEALLNLLGIADLRQRWPATLSGGEARRVAIARALLAAPDFLLLDEPSSSLDPERTEDFAALVERLDIPVVLVSHDEAQVARLAQHVVTMG